MCTLYEKQFGTEVFHSYNYRLRFLYLNRISRKHVCNLKINLKIFFTALDICSDKNNFFYNSYAI